MKKNNGSVEGPDDRRTGTTTLGLWPEGKRPDAEYTHDIDDWLAAIATGRCLGLTAEATAAQYRRDDITYRPLRDADPIPVHLIWRPHDAHPATHTAIALAAHLYRRGTNPSAPQTAAPDWPSAWPEARTSGFGRRRT